MNGSARCAWSCAVSMLCTEYTQSGLQGSKCMPVELSKLERQDPSVFGIVGHAGLLCLSKGCVSETENTFLLQVQQGMKCTLGTLLHCPNGTFWKIKEKNLLVIHLRTI